MKEIKGIYQKYKEDVVPNWIEKKGSKSSMAVPRITKVAVNMGLGAVKEDAKALEQLVAEFTQIVGQKPLVTKAHRAIAGFNVREGMNVGVKVTLRGKKMYAFMEKVFNYVLPRTRDFRGLPRDGFDGNGNYSFGLVDQMVFLEIDPNKVKRRHGMQATIVTNTNDDTIAAQLLTDLGLPFAKEEE